jgi:hypothetical protein
VKAAELAEFTQSLYDGSTCGGADAVEPLVLGQELSQKLALDRSVHHLLDLPGDGPGD